MQADPGPQGPAVLGQTAQNRPRQEEAQPVGHLEERISGTQEVDHGKQGVGHEIGPRSSELLTQNTQEVAPEQDLFAEGQDQGHPHGLEPGLPGEGGGGPPASPGQDKPVRPDAQQAQPQPPEQAGQAWAPQGRRSAAWPAPPPGPEGGGQDDQVQASHVGHLPALRRAPVQQGGGAAQEEAGDQPAGQPACRERAQQGHQAPGQPHPGGPRSPAWRTSPRARRSRMSAMALPPPGGPRRSRPT